MEWLEAALAFAITMLVFSTMASIVMETLHRGMNLRHKGLRVMLAKLFDEVIWPRARVRLSRAFERQGRTVDVEAIKTEFLDALTRSRGDGNENGLLRWALKSKMARSLTTYDFMQRLADTDVGRAIVDEADVLEGKVHDALETLLDDLIVRYDSFCDDAREYFQRRARLVTVIIGFGLALSLNVDAVRLFQTYLKDQDLRTEIISQRDTFEEQARLQIEKTKNASEDVAAADVNAEQEIKEIRENAEEMKALFAMLKDAQVPIGWDYFPFGDKGQGPFGDRIGETGGKLAITHWGQCVGNYLAWAMGIALAGLMIGLGSPFWFDAIRGLSSVLGVARHMGAGRSQDKNKQDTQTSGTTAQPVKPVTPKEAFKTTYKANQQVTAQTGRRPLLTDMGKTDHGEGLL